MKKIIVVKGKSEVGKTTSIKQIYQWIKTNYIVRNILPNTWTGADIKTIIEADNFRIGICSAGDYGDIVKSYLAEFEKYNCHLIICACRTKGETFHAIQSYWSKGYLIDYIRVSKISNNTFVEIKRRLMGLSNNTNKINVFSYGSNMLYNRIAERVKSAKVIGNGYITGHTLRFHKISKDESGKANIYQTDDSKNIVWGVIIQLDLLDKPILDGFEGLGYGYEEKEVRVNLPDNLEIGATVYVAEEKSIDEELKPYDWYYNFVVEGAKENKLPEEYIDMISKTEFVVDKDEKRKKKNEEILKKNRR